MNTRYGYWEIVDGLPLVAPPLERDVSEDAITPLLDELANRIPVETFGDGYEGDKAWISFLDVPRAFHIYFEASPDHGRYELYFDAEKVSGVATLAALKKAALLFMRRQSPAGFLQTHSSTVYETEA